MPPINRRRWFRAAGAGAVGAGAVALAPHSASAATEYAAPPGVTKVALGEEIRLDAQSSAIEMGSSKFSIVSLGVCKLTLDSDQRLKAIVKAAVTQYTHIEYWISLAAFDKRGAFLGAATHKQAVTYMRLGVMLTMLPELEFDFGISKRYEEIAGLAVAISDRDVPKPLGF